MQAHIAEAVSNAGLGEVSKKQAAAFLDELGKLLIDYAPVGATLPGIGKLVLRKTKARIGRNPQTGEPIKIKAKKKLAFRISKQAKEAAGIV
ncbi:MAG: HU family DNA-binding protein [Planctomycetota bacterium]|nr:HU family DNA-binding protein [Planctomycetota bacterium]